ncbi:MAG: hemolysin family protein [Myxococcota bacterium]
MLLLVLAVFAVVASSALCSGAEAALLSVSDLRLQQLAEGGNQRAARVLRMKSNLARPISAIVVLNNVANIVGSIAVGSLASQVLGSNLLGAFSAVLTILIILFAEIVPKTLGTRHSEILSLWLAAPLSAIVFVLTPLLWLLDKFTGLFGKDVDGMPINESQIRFLARLGGVEGSIDRDEVEMLQRVFQLDDHTAQDIMTPRTLMTWLRADQPLSEVKEAIRNSQHSRLVVVGETLDKIVGVVLVRDALLGLMDDETVLLDAELDWVRPAQFVLPDRPADRLLELFLKSRNHLALVRDEFGMVLGVVTLEDVQEILTGEIVDETDRAVDLQAVARARQAARRKKPV